MTASPGRDIDPAASVADLAIRPAEPRDLDALVEIYLASARHHAELDPAYYTVPPRDAVRDRLARLVDGQSETAAYLVAEAAEGVAGSLTVRVESVPSTGSMITPVPTAEIGIAVLEAWRGRGIGTRLMTAGETWARERGIERLLLDTSARNTAAVRLYERLGYGVEGLFLRKAVSSE